MAVRFIPVADLKDPLNVTIGLSGTSGTGKTYSALRVAKGLADGFTGVKNAPIGIVDTENRRALHYREAFPQMVHFDMKAVDDNNQMIGFTPERWIEVIDAAEEAKLPVLVIDSFSHSWEGVGGVLDMHATELERAVSEAQERANGRYTVDPSKFSEKAWIVPKARYRRLVDRIVRARCNIVICNRAKPVRQTGFGENAKNARQTKLRREDVPFDIAGDANLIFEMTASIILDPKAPGCPVHQIKVADQFKALFDPTKPMSEETGRLLGEWAAGLSDAQRQKDLMDAARAAARNGRAAWNKFWEALPPSPAPDRSIIKRIVPELQGLVEQAEANAAKSQDDNPVGQDPMIEARSSGAAAAADGEPESACPYPEGSDLAAAWLGTHREVTAERAEA